MQILGPCSGVTVLLTKASSCSHILAPHSAMSEPRFVLRKNGDTEAFSWCAQHPRTSKGQRWDRTKASKQLARRCCSSNYGPRLLFPFSASIEIPQARLKQNEAGQPLIPEEGYEQKDTFCRGSDSLTFPSWAGASVPGDHSWCGKLVLSSQEPITFLWPFAPSPLWGFKNDDIGTKAKHPIMTKEI